MKTGSAIGFGSFWDGDYTPNRFGGISVDYDLEGRMITLYYPYIPAADNDFTTGSTLILSGYDNSESYMTESGGIEIATKDLTTTVDNAVGKVYTLSF